MKQWISALCLISILVLSSCKEQDLDLDLNGNQTTINIEHPFAIVSGEMKPGKENLKAALEEAILEELQALN